MVLQFEILYLKAGEKTGSKYDFYLIQGKKKTNWYINNRENFLFRLLFDTNKICIRIPVRIGSNFLTI